MATVATVFGRWITFFHDDHEPAHFHVRAAGFAGRMALAGLSVQSAASIVSGCGKT